MSCLKSQDQVESKGKAASDGQPPAQPSVSSAKLCPMVWVHTGPLLPAESCLVIHSDLFGREQFK